MFLVRLFFKNEENEEEGRKGERKYVLIIIRNQEGELYVVEI